MTLNKPKIFRDIDTINASLGEKANKDILYKDIKDFIPENQLDSNGLPIVSEVTDYSSYFQDAIDYCAENGIILLISEGIYNIRNSLSITEGYQYRIEGINKQNSPYGYLNGANCCIRNIATNGLFVGANISSMTSCTFIMSGIQIQCFNNPVFVDTNLKRSNIFYLTVSEPSYFIKGSITFVSRIFNNDIEGINNAFLAPSTNFPTLESGMIVDSWVYKNYINGKPSSLATFIICGGGFSHSSIHGNFIDFFKYIFSRDLTISGSTIGGNLRFHDNILDYVYRFNQYQVNNMSIQNNLFSKFSSTYISSFTADSEMSSNPWGVFIYNLANVSILGNQVISCDNFFNMVNATVENVRVKENQIISGVTTAYNLGHYVADASALGYTSVYVDKLDNVLMSSFVAPINGNRVKYAEYSKVYYNNKLLTSIGGNWYDTAGVQVTS